MKKFIYLLLLFYTVNCCAWWKSLDNAILEHEEAFKKLEPEAKDITVKVDTQTYGNKVIANYTYTPHTHNITLYLTAYKNLIDATRDRALIKAMLIGLILGTANSLVAVTNKSLINQLDKACNERLILIPVIVSILTAIGVNLHDDSTKKAERYFDPETLKKHENFFAFNTMSFARILFSTTSLLATEALSGMAIYALFDKVLNRS